MSWHRHPSAEEFPCSHSMIRTGIFRTSVRPPTAVRHCGRCWITGGLTVVALTVTSLGSHHSGSLARLSRFSPTETIARLAAHAQAYGLSVFARIPLQDREGRGEWLVLGLAEDETAIVQSEGPEQIVSLPLTMRITAEAGGGSRIQFHATDELPRLPRRHAAPAAHRGSGAAGAA